MGECTSEDKSLCYVPMPSLGHELGILFGFVGKSISASLPLSLCRVSSAVGGAHARKWRSHRSERAQSTSIWTVSTSVPCSL